MKKNKFLEFFLVCFLLGCTDLKAQNTESKLFSNFCNEIEKLDHFYAIKNNLPGTLVINDPVTGKKDIKYGAPSTSLDEFKSRTKNEQLEILNSINLPIIPLKDTILILDSLFTFSSEQTCKVGNKYFKIVRILDAKTGSLEIGIKRLSIKGDDLSVVAFFIHNTKLASFTFKVEGAKFTSIRKSIIDPKDRHWRH